MADFGANENNHLYRLLLASCADIALGLLLFDTIVAFRAKPARRVIVHSSSYRRGLQ
ncbi:hypothetical protein D3C78_1959860 [compost metagenome]